MKHLAQTIKALSHSIRLRIIMIGLVHVAFWFQRRWFNIVI